MTIAVIAALGILGYFVLSLLGVFKLSPLHLALYSIPLLIFSVRDYSQSWIAPERLAELVLAFVAGYMLKYFFSSFVQRSGGTLPLAAAAPVLRSARSPVRFAPVAVVVALGFTIYHFAQLGIPLLAGDVETARFDIGDSGLAGIPSRMYLYGLPLVLALAASEAKSVGKTVAWKDGWVGLAFAALIVSRLLSGFKSGLLNAVIVVLLIWCLSSGRVAISRYRGRILLAVVLVIGAGLAIATQYSSYDSNGRTLTENLEERLTDGSAAGPATLLILTPADLGTAQSTIMIDVKYFANRYAGIGPPQPYGFTRLLSGAIIGEDPASSVFLPPVTMTGYAVAYYDLGGWAFIVIALIGAVAAAIGSWGRRQYGTSPVQFMVAFGVFRLIIDYLSKGETVYAVLNWGSSIVFLVVVTGITFALRRRTHERENAVLPAAVNRSQRHASVD